MIDFSILAELENFLKSQTLKQVLLVRIAAQIPEKEIINLKNIFNKIDKNGNGLISL